MKKSKSTSTLETPAPPQCRVLSMEIESYYRKIAEIEAKDFRNDDLAVYKAEILMRLDLYRLSSGNAYERIPDVARGDKTASIKLFSELNGHGWKEKFGWSGQGKTTVRPEVPMFEAEGSLFDGLQVSERRVTGIVLTNNGCEGQLSDRIGDFAALNTLYLDYNNIDGKLPRGLGRLELLEYINLSGNCFVGELEERSLTKLTTLRILNLSFNQLGGVLPDCFDCMTKLQELNLSGNQFNGRLPSTMSTCVNLRHLNLYSNHFEGNVPEWLGNFSSLTTINLSQNKFTGGINQLFNCPKLKKIQFTSNQLTTPLSTSISNLTNLNLLYLHHNAITGRIPHTICSMNSLQFLNLSYNEFSGTVPENIGNLYQLKLFILSHTQLTGPLPDSISKLTNLSDFHIFTPSNSETMSLPRAFQRQTFERVYCWGTKVGIDNVTWTEPKTNEFANIFDKNDDKKKKKKKGNQLRFEDSDEEEEIADVLERLRKQQEEGIDIDEQSDA